MGQEGSGSVTSVLIGQLMRDASTKDKSPEILPYAEGNIC